jgi:tetratricopeptide (TPR) repeat protein
MRRSDQASGHRGLASMIEASKIATDRIKEHRRWSRNPRRGLRKSPHSRLGRLVVGLLNEPEAQGLLALMLLHEARRTARLDAAGDVVLLEDQDRSLWDRKRIAEANAIIERAMACRKAGSYLLQAMIASTHVEAPSFELTDWPRIVSLYDALYRIERSPIVALNKAAALAMRDGAEAGLAAIDAVIATGNLDDYPYAHAARADLLQRLGRARAARASFERALALTHQPSEQRFLLRRLERLEAEWVCRHVAGPARWPGEDHLACIALCDHSTIGRLIRLYTVGLELNAGLRRGCGVGVTAPVVAPRMFDVALHLPAICAGFLVTGSARALRGSACRAVVATLAATVHAIGLRGRRRDASEHHDGSQDSNASPKPHLSSHKVLPRYGDRSAMTLFEGPWKSIRAATATLESMVEEPKSRPIESRRSSMAGKTRFLDPGPHRRRARRESPLYTKRKILELIGNCTGGADADRTRDLLNAICESSPSRL